jgi:tRNA A37 threonylcarbamoyltransferase TsaD
VEFRFGPIRRKTADSVLPTSSAEDAARMGHPSDGGPTPTSQNRDVGHPESEDKRRFPSGMTNKSDDEHSAFHPGMINKNDPTSLSFRTPSVAEGEESASLPTFDFSFSGIKTAVLRYVQTHGMKERVEARRARLGAALKEQPDLRADDAVREMPEVFDQQTLDLIASFQFAVVGNLLKQTFAAAEAWGARGVIVSGGVAANSELRRRFAEEAARRGMRVEFPAMAMATDNAAMIAAAAWGKFAVGEFAGDELVARAGLRLG